MLTAELLRLYVTYNQDTGIFTWKARPESMFKNTRTFHAWHTRYCGVNAGGISGDGYLSIRIDYKPYWAHRLAWLYIYGTWPEGNIDHIDGNKQNNRITNLRDTTPQTNSQNTPISKLSGVHFCQRKKTRKFASSIKVNGEQMHLGYFETEEEAHRIYIEAKIKYHSGFLLRKTS